MALRRKNQYPRAGDLNRQMEIKVPTWASDGKGGRTVSGYTVADTVWVQAKPIRGSRLSEYGLTINQKPREIKLRTPLWVGTPDYTLDEDVILNLKDDSIELIIQDVMDIDDMREWTMIIAVERK